MLILCVCTKHTLKPIPTRIPSQILFQVARPSVRRFHAIFCQWKWNRRLIDFVCIYSKGKIYNSINIAAVTTLAETSEVTTYKKTSSCTRGGNHTRTQLKQNMLLVKVGKFGLIQSASISILTVEQLRNHTIVKDKTSEKRFSKDLELNPICSSHTTFYIKRNNSHETQRF